MNARYQGKPLLRVLECYVLWSLDELSDSDKKSLDLMEPKLQEVYGKSGSWVEIISSVMELPENMPDLIRDMWGKNQAIAKVNNSTLTAEQFAQVFVDQNFSGAM